MHNEQKSSAEPPPPVLAQSPAQQSLMASSSNSAIITANNKSLHHHHALSRFCNKKLVNLLGTSVTLHPSSNLMVASYSSTSSLFSSTSAASSVSSGDSGFGDDAAGPCSLTIDLRQFLLKLRQSLTTYGIKVEQVLLTGGAASYVLLPQNNNKAAVNKEPLAFNDIDLEFKVAESTSSKDFDFIRQIAFRLLQKMLISATGDGSSNMVKAFISKMCKVYGEKERWSVISLGKAPKCIDLKFVAKIERSYQFSVDSFCVVIDDSLLTTQPSDIINNAANNNNSKSATTAVYAYSSSGDFQRALYDLMTKKIATDHPENIRGGGLLRYCDLLSKGYRLKVRREDFLKTEECMCTRYFIDFMDVSQQAIEIDRYLRNHFDDIDPRRRTFLHIVFNVIRRSSLCVMHRERQMAEGIVTSFILNESFRKKV